MLTSLLLFQVEKIQSSCRITFPGNPNFLRLNHNYEFFCLRHYSAFWFQKLWPEDYDHSSFKESTFPRQVDTEIIPTSPRLTFILATKSQPTVNKKIKPIFLKKISWTYIIALSQCSPQQSRYCWRPRASLQHNQLVADQSLEYLETLLSLRTILLESSILPFCQPRSSLTLMIQEAISREPSWLRQTITELVFLSKYNSRISPRAVAHSVRSSEFPCSRDPVLTDYSISYSCVPRNIRWQL